jgi:fibronectin type 3 domain-containing protein
VTGTEGSVTHAASVSLTVTSAAGVPGAPTLTARRTNRRGVQLNWTVPPSNGSPISAYRIYRGTAAGTEQLLIQRGGGSTSYRDTSTTSGTLYFYQVTAVNGVGEGPRSNEASAIAR